MSASANDRGILSWFDVPFNQTPSIGRDRPVQDSSLSVSLAVWPGLSAPAWRSVETGAAIRTVSSANCHGNSHPQGLENETRAQVTKLHYPLG